MTPRPAIYDCWVWHRSSADGRSAAEKEFTGLPAVAQARLWQKMNKFLTGSYSPRDVDNLGDGILEIRVKLGSNPYRVIFCCDGRRCVVLTAFHKKDQRTPKKDLDRAKVRRRTWGQ